MALNDLLIKDRNLKGGTRVYTTTSSTNSLQAGLNVDDVFSGNDLDHFDKVTAQAAAPSVPEVQKPAEGDLLFLNDDSLI